MYQLRSVRDDKAVRHVLVTRWETLEDLRRDLEKTAQVDYMSLVLSWAAGYDTEPLILYGIDMSDTWSKLD